MTDEGIVDVLTGNVTVTVYDANDKPVKNALVSLIDENDNRISGLSNRLGECLIENVIYDTYTVLVTRTGYESCTDTIIVDDETITETFTLTHSPVDPNQIEVDLDETYTFTIRERLTPEFSMSTEISNWLKTNLESLKDDYNKSLFGKVNLGYSEESLRTFGKKPVCDVYIDTVEYNTDFDYEVPVKVNTFVLFYFKGANSPVYSKACELHDLLMQEFLSNKEWRESNVVRHTTVTNSEIRIQPINKKWGVMGAFELSHELYY